MIELYSQAIYATSHLVQRRSAGLRARYLIHDVIQDQTTVVKGIRAGSRHRPVGGNVGLHHLRKLTNHLRTLKIYFPHYYT